MFPVLVQLLGLLLNFENASVVPGGLPDRLAGLPLPERTQVAVSYVRRDNPFGFSANVVLRSKLDAGALYTRTERVLERGGWQPVRVPPPCFESLLFKDTSLPPCETELSRTPFFQKDGLTLLLPVPMGGPGSSSRMTLDITSGGLPSAYFFPEPEPTGLVRDLVPKLVAPTGDALSSGFEAALSGVNQDEMTGSATVTTDLSPAQLAGHFATQLTAVGWRVTERRFEEGSAVVRLERRNGENVYDAQLTVSRPKGQTYNDVYVRAALRAGK